MDDIKNDSSDDDLALSKSTRLQNYSINKIN